MCIDKVKVIYFSPTGTTRKIVTDIAAGTGAETREFQSLKPGGDPISLDKNTPDLVIIGMPTYISRIPPEAAMELRKIKGNGIPVVLVAVYGNNKFGDILLEMRDIAVENGFKPVAAAAFIGEHSFSTKDMSIAGGRPDMQDSAAAKKFGRELKDLLSDRDANYADFSLDVPGAFPYREWNKLPVKPPSTDEELCVQCSRCQQVCPVNAISGKSKLITDPSLCIFCCACVKICPVSARAVIDDALLQIRERLFSNCGDRKEPEFFFGKK